MEFKVGDLVEYRMTNHRLEMVVQNVIITSFEPRGWVAVFDGQKTTLASPNSLRRVE